MPKQTDNIAEASIQWALEHVLRFGDTDILPPPFEYDAIAADRENVVAFLSGTNFFRYQARPNGMFLVPKPGTGFRVVHRLDPLDALLYTGAVHEICEEIEQSRIAPELCVACSYRVNLDESGRFFMDDSGWPDFQEQSAKLAKQHDFVLLADIADFYNQLYQHRVESSLDTAAVARLRAENIESFLSQLTAQQSRGLPVGPFASIVLAEACLNDVDQHLQSRGLRHTRYVDDFRIFCESRKDCLKALHDLTEYLYTAHRLCLQSSKTKITGIKKFRERKLTDPKRTEEQKTLDKLQDLIDDIYAETGYSVELDEIPEDDVNAAVRRTLKDMLERIIDEPRLRLGPARYILRRSRALRTRVILPILLKNLEFMSPVFRDVAQYLIAVMPKQKARYLPIGNALLKLAKSDIGELPFIREWLFYIFQRHPKLARTPNDLAALADESRSTLGIRPRALWALATSDVAWVRSMKEKWRAVGPWDQRSILWSGAVLPASERRAWLKPLKTSDDPLIRAVALSAIKG